MFEKRTDFNMHEISTYLVENERWMRRSQCREMTRRLVVELDAVGLERDLATDIALTGVSILFPCSPNPRSKPALTPRFFLFFSFLNPAPRVTIRSRLALAP
jgi:hypothetical protein